MYRLHIIRAAIFLAVGLVLGFLVVQFSPKIFQSESSVLVQDAGQNQRPSAMIDDEVQRILQAGELGTIRSEAEILRSPAIFIEALTAVLDRKGDRSILEDQTELTKLYQMYDVIVPKSDSPYDPVRVATIRVKTFDREISADVANEITNIYNISRVRAARNAATDALTYLEAQSATAKIALEASDEKLKVYQTQNNIVDFSLSAQGQQQLEQATTKQRGDVLAQLSATQAEVAALRGEMGSISKTTRIASERPDPTLETLQGNLANLESRRADLLTQYFQDAPPVKEVDSYIKTLKGRITSYRANIKGSFGSVSADPVFTQMSINLRTKEALVSNLRANLAEVDTELGRLKARSSELPNIGNEITKLQRDRAILDDRFKMLKAQTELIRNRINGESKAAIVVSSAQPSLEAVSPDPRRFMILAGILGLACGIVYSFAIESLKLPVYTSTQLTEITGLPVVASMPALPRNTLRQRLMSLNQSGFKPIESFRFMAVNLITKDPPPKSLILSAVGESVDTAGPAAELAISIAKAGHRVILIDADLRKSQLSRLFAPDKTVGISDLLSRTLLPEKANEDPSFVTAHENLRFIPAGSGSGVLGLSDFSPSAIKGITEYLQTFADIVIINTPPCNVVSDAARLVPFVDEVCLLVSAKSTSFREIPVAQDLMKRANAKSVSIILTNGSTTDEPFARSSVATASQTPKIK